MRLSELKSGESATILKVNGHGGFRRRIMEMGFVRGQRVEVLLNAPLKDPIEYRIMGYDISLRRSEADMVEVLSDSEARQLADEQAHRPTADEERDGAVGSDLPETGSVERVIHERSRHIEVALVGNPNSGKTSLFNAISGGHEHVGNYSGVTVGAKRGHCTYRGYTFEVTDLPGTYALSAYTPEERFVRSHIEKNNPDVIVNAVVASNLERNLYLTTELIDINPRIVVALNMYDELDASGATLDYDSLGRMLGVPMVPVEARNNKGIEALLDTVIAVYENRDERVRHIHIGMGPVVEESVRRLHSDMNAFGISGNSFENSGLSRRAKSWITPPLSPIFMMPSQSDNTPVSPNEISNAVLEEAKVELIISGNTAVSPKNTSLTSATTKARRKNAIQM